MANPSPALTDDQIQQARGTLYREVHMPIFLTKLANAGIVPGSDDERLKLLELGDALLASHYAGEQSAKKASSSLIGAVYNDLATRLGGTGAVEAAQLKQAAAAGIQDPNIRNAALTLAAALNG